MKKRRFLVRSNKLTKYYYIYSKYSKLNNRKDNTYEYEHTRARKST